MKDVKPVPKTVGKDLVGQTVKKMNCHAGLILNGLAVTGLHYDDNKCAMTITPYGVHVSLFKTPHRPAAKLLVTWANIYFVELMVDEEAA